MRRFLFHRLAYPSSSPVGVSRESDAAISYNRYDELQIGERLFGPNRLL